MDLDTSTKEQLLKQIAALQAKIVGLGAPQPAGALPAPEAPCENMELYRILVESSPLPVFLVDLKSTIIMANEPAGRMLLFDGGNDLVGKSFFAVFVTDQRQRMRDNIEKLLQTGTIKNVEGVLLKKDGALVPVEVSFSAIRDTQGKAQGFIGTLVDITDRRRIEAELRRRIEFENILNSLSSQFTLDIECMINDVLKIIGKFAEVDRSFIVLISEENKKVHGTHEWCAPGVESRMPLLKNLSEDMLPWLVEQIRAKRPVRVSQLSALPPEAALEKKLWEAGNIKSIIGVPMEYQETIIGLIGFTHNKEEKPWGDDTLALLRLTGTMCAGVIIRQQLNRDIKKLNRELLQTNMKLKQLALRDSLTGLYNHHYFEEAIEAEYIRAKRQGLPLSVIMLDIDYFKSINDVYGHQFGDMVLKQLATQLTRMVRKYDTVIRYGGEEFIIITPGAGKEIALILAQRLLDVIKLENFGDKQHRVKLKLSVAVTAFPDDKILHGSDFIKMADVVLNKVKELGGDRVSSYSEVKKGKLPTSREIDDAADVHFLREKLDKLTKRANQSLVEAIFAFAKTIEMKDHYTGEHVEKTVHYATEIARERGLPADEVERVKQASVLHDLGKIGISEKILCKKTKLTAREYEQIKEHPQIGADILRPIHFFHAIIPLILHHHERWDGKGYPYGLKGEEIPLGARIIALADTYEALTANRRYRKACSQKIAIKKIQEVSGTQFDPEIVAVFLRVIEKEQTGRV